jgi:hypothetical protein
MLADKYPDWADMRDQLTGALAEKGDISTLEVE